MTHADSLLVYGFVVSFLVVACLILWEPAAHHYRLWKLKRAFESRDKASKARLSASSSLRRSDQRTDGQSKD